MDDSGAAVQVVEGVIALLGIVGTVPAGLAAGLTALASAAGYFFGVKHEKKRERKRNQFGSVEASEDGEL